MKIRSINSVSNAGPGHLSPDGPNSGVSSAESANGNRAGHQAPGNWLVPGAQWVRQTSAGLPLALRVIGSADEKTLRHFLDSLDEQVIQKRFGQPVVSYDRFQKLLENTRGLTVIGMKNKQPVALAEYYDTTVKGSDYRKCEIAVLVHQDHQRSGIGKTLVNEVIRIARMRGYQRIEWLASNSNQPVHHLSKDMGVVLRPFEQERGYKQGVLPVWFSGLGKTAQHKIFSLLSTPDQENVIRADPSFARLRDDASSTQSSATGAGNQSKIRSKL